MNLIYICVFHQESYIELLRLLIESMAVNGNINRETTDILVITSPGYQPLIDAKIAGYNLPLRYYILDLHTLFEAGCARLNIFNYERIQNYEKILYLDTDILINNDVNTLFNLETDSTKLYALAEGKLETWYHGGQFFDFTKFDRNQTAFTSGILYFYNSPEIQDLFRNINNHIQEHIYVQHNQIPGCLDQPFIVYHAVSENKYNNTLLNTYAQNGPAIVNKQFIIYHFPGVPGNPNKLNKMIYFWRRMKTDPAVFIPLTFIENKSYSWENNHIKFLDNCNMDAFGKGYYEYIDAHTIRALFGYKDHILKFNDDYTEFISTRVDDSQRITGTLLA